MISDLGWGILEILDTAEEPLSSKEVAERLSDSRDRRIVGGRVRVYLEHGLDEYVNRVASDLWTICSPHHGKFSPSKRPASAQKDSKSASDGIKETASRADRVNELILRILEKTNERLKAKELSDAISSVIDNVSTKGVNRRLYGELSEQVDQDSAYRWGLSDKGHSGAESDEGKDSGTNTSETLKAESNDQKKETSNSKDRPEPEKIVEAVLLVLADAEEPLYTTEIIRRVRGREDKVEWEGFDRLLPENVNAQVRSNSDSKWNLVETPPELTQDSDDAESIEEDRQGQEEAEPSGSESSGTFESEGRDATQRPDVFSPDGIVGEINAGLETAKQIALLLDLAPSPLSMDRIEELLNATGHDVSESTVRYCLRSILNPFVQEEEDGYRLEDTGPELSEEELDAAPVDAATRATIGGQRYNYVFSASAQDGSSLFSSQIRGGTVEVKLNASHPAFRGLRQVLSEKRSVENASVRQLHHLIKLLIASWTDMEGDLRGRRKEIAEEFREDWGRAVRLLLRERE